jgi:hypothetical protein
LSLAKLMITKPKRRKFLKILKLPKILIETHNILVILVEIRQVRDKAKEIKKTKKQLILLIARVSRTVMKFIFLTIRPEI